jgi:hypothetical protein
MAPQTANSLPQPRAFPPGKMVTLLVGPEEQAMVVHGDCLSRDSAFFKAALKREWGPDRAIRIPEETPLLMGYYVEHLYGGPLPTHQLKSGPNVLDPDQPSYELLATLYVLGERMLDPYYREKIIREFLRLLRHDSIHSWPGPKAVSIIYQGTTAESPVRRLMANFAVNYAYTEILAGFAAADPGYLLDVGLAFLRKVKWQCEISEFRYVGMIAEDYFVDEEA